MLIARSGQFRCALRRQQGLTLLEVLIALSIFALIGVASFRVLGSVIDAQKTGDNHSRQLAQFQKALMIIDSDLQQLVSRDIRSALDQKEHYLQIKNEPYPLQLTRAGRVNPLKLARSSMQRVAYDIGLHPKVNDNASEHYGSERKYLRRFYWPALDRTGETKPLVQVLLADIDKLQVAALTDNGRYTQWPPDKNNRRGTKDDSELLAIEFTFIYPVLGKLTRLYKVN